MQEGLNTETEGVFFSEDLKTIFIHDLPVKEEIKEELSAKEEVKEIKKSK